MVIDARVGPMRVTAFIMLVRRLTDNRALTFVMTTSRTGEMMEAAGEAGVDGVLLKPFTPADLSAQIAAAVERKRAFPHGKWDHSRHTVVMMD